MSPEVEGDDHRTGDRGREGLVRDQFSGDDAGEAVGVLVDVIGQEKN